MLIVSVPTLTWKDLDPTVAPNLARFLDQAAIADLATRADRQPAALGAAYVTIGAGARAAGDDATDGEGLEVTERFGAVSAGAAFRQRTATAPGTGIVALGIARIESANASLLYGAVPGALGDTLTRHGYSTDVVANGDGAPPEISASAPAYARSAVSALMGEDGRLAHGEVGRTLLQHDSTAPFGARLDQAAVVAAFARAWGKHSVALVEASDLVRADKAASYATSDGAARLRRRALHWSDQLFGALMRHVDLSRDAVLVVAPVPPAGNRSVTVAGLRAPGVEAGLLRSATTRRSGFVTLADVAPTVLDQLGIAAPESMEGRPMLDEAGNGSAADRRAVLEQASVDGQLRDDLVNSATATVLWTAIVLAVASALLLVVVPSFLRRRPWLALAIQWIALALVGFLLATMPATLLHFGEHGGKAGFWSFTLVFAVLFAIACRLLAVGNLSTHCSGRSARCSRSTWSTSSPVVTSSSIPCSATPRRWASAFRGSATSRRRCSPPLRCSSPRSSPGASHLLGARGSPSPCWSSPSWRSPHRSSARTSVAPSRAPRPSRSSVGCCSVGASPCARS